MHGRGRRNGGCVGSGWCVQTEFYYAKWLLHPSSISIRRRRRCQRKEIQRKELLFFLLIEKFAFFTVFPPKTDIHIDGGLDSVMRQYCAFNQKQPLALCYPDSNQSERVYPPFNTLQKTKTTNRDHKQYISDTWRGFKESDSLPSVIGEVGEESGRRIPLCTKSSLLARIDILLSKAVIRTKLVWLTFHLSEYLHLEAASNFSDFFRFFHFHGLNNLPNADSRLGGFLSGGGDLIVRPPSPGTLTVPFVLLPFLPETQQTFNHGNSL